jgi:DNA-binding NtrC family response regulator
MKVDKILLIDDESQVRGVLSDLLRERGHAVLGVSTLGQARQVLATEAFELILCDLRLQDGEGLAFLEELRKAGNKAHMIVLTGYATLDSALRAIQLGVFDFLVKPIDPRQIDIALDRLETLLKLEAENAYLRSEQGQEKLKDIIWGTHPAMTQLRQLVEKVGRAETTVLICGESGTGKEVIAQSLVSFSGRSDKPFIKVNCAAVTANLLESEFFGHEKGAFTGAVQRREGRFELAHTGTLLLDEISEIPPDLQVKLLRVLQEREFERVGGNKTIQVDVRVLATTNRRLEEEVKAGRFREDLYYRLNVVPLHLPPLRERGLDLLVMAEYFLQRFSRKHGKHLKGFSPSAAAKLASYAWPGNVRELQNVIERAAILSEHPSQVQEGDLLIVQPFASRAASVAPMPDAVALLPVLSEDLCLDKMEQRMIEEAMKRCHGNRTHAARILNISLRTLRNKLNAKEEAPAGTGESADSG